MQSTAAGVSTYLKARTPSCQNLLAVYAFVSFVSYSWTLLISFYRLPAWLFYLDLGEILSVYAYVFSFNLLECILALCVLFLLEFTIFLPFHKDGFQARSLIFTMVIFPAAMIRLAMFQNYEMSSVSFSAGELIWWAVAFGIGFLAAVIGAKIPFLKTVFESFADRMVVFLYVYIPISVISPIVLLVRNI